MEYYWLSFNEQQIKTVAYAPAGTPLSHRIISEMKGKELLPFDFEIHQVDSTDGLVRGYSSSLHYDYQANSMAWPLMSDTLRSIIDSCLTGREDLSWIRARLIGKDNDVFNYNIPFFNSFLDTLDTERSVIAKSSNMVIRPCFNKEKLKEFSVFHGPTMFWQITSKFYVNEIIMESIISQNLTGVSFSGVKIV